VGLAAVVFVVLLWRADLSPARFRAIKVGMSRAEVEQLYPGQVPFGGTREDSGKIWVAFTGIRDDLERAGPGDFVGVWDEDEGRIVVRFDPRDLVVEKRYIRNTKSLLERLKKFLGW
jgi:hypothetical protein